MCEDTRGDPGFIGDILQNRLRWLITMFVMIELVKLRDLSVVKERYRLLIHKHIMYVCVSPFLGNKCLTTDTANSQDLISEMQVQVQQGNSFPS